MKLLVPYPQCETISSHSALCLGCVMGLGWEGGMCVFTGICVSGHMDPGK